MRQQCIASRPDSVLLILIEELISVACFEACERKVKTWRCPCRCSKTENPLVSSAHRSRASGSGVPEAGQKRRTRPWRLIAEAAPTRARPWGTLRGRGWPVRRQDDLTDFQSSAIPLIRKKEYGNLDDREGLEWMVRLAEAWMPKLARDSSVVLNLGEGWCRGEPTLSFYHDGDPSGLKTNAV